MTWTLCTSRSAIVKAGNNAGAIGLSGSIMQKWSDDVEGYVVAFTRKDWVVDYSSTPTALQGILSDVCSDLIAKKIINWDMSGYTTLQEAQTMLNVLDDNAQRGLNLLKDSKSDKVRSIN